MISKLSRRQMLTVTASTMIATSAAYSTSLLLEQPLMIRQMATWSNGVLQCWCDGQASDLPYAVEDLQSLWSERTIVDHINFENFERDMKLSTPNSLPFLKVGSAASNDLNDAAQTAFSRAGSNELRNANRAYWAGVAAVSMSHKSFFLENLKSIRSWMAGSLPRDAFFDTQMLVDPALNGNSKRVTVVVAT